MAFAKGAHRVQRPVLAVASQTPQRDLSNSPLFVPHCLVYRGRLPLGGEVLLSQQASDWRFCFTILKTPPESSFLFSQWPNWGKKGSLQAGPECANSPQPSWTGMQIHSLPPPGQGEQSHSSYKLMTALPSSVNFHNPL